MKRKILILSGTSILIAMIGWQRFKNFRDRGFESSGRDFIKSCSIVQTAYRKTYQKYLTDPLELKKCSVGFPKEYVMYYAAGDLPEEFKQNLAPQDQPFVSESSYQMLLTIKHRYRDETFFWIVKDDNEPQMLTTRVSGH